VKGTPLDDLVDLGINNTLKKVVILFRHGDRSLHDVGGKGSSAQLTLYGARRMIHLGQFIRRRYDKFLTDDVNEVQARSIALKRCINSLQVVLAGMYPVFNKEDQILPGLSWQPIPIFMERMVDDSILFTESYCPRADIIFPAMSKGPIMQQLNRDNREFFEFISDKSGRNITSLSSASWYHDDLVVYQAEGIPLPEWIDDQIFRKLESFTDLLFTFRSIDPLQQRLRGGPFIHEVLNVMRKNESVILHTGKQDDEDASPHKVYIYAAKRYTLSLVMSALGVFNNRSSLAGATLFFELHQSHDKEFIRLYHLNLSDSEVLYELTPKGCPSFNCPWNTFAESVQHLIPVDLKRECSFTGASSSAISLETNVSAQIALLFLFRYFLSIEY
jgi:hypothetical protein